MKGMLSKHVSILRIILALLIVLSGFQTIAVTILGENGEEANATQSVQERDKKLAEFYVVSAERLLTFLKDVLEKADATVDLSGVIANITELVNEAKSYLESGDYQKAIVYSKEAIALARATLNKVLSVEEKLRIQERLREQLREHIRERERIGLVQRIEALSHLVKHFAEKYGVGEDVIKELREIVEKAKNGEITWGEARSEIAHILNQVKNEYRKRALEENARKRALDFITKHINSTVSSLFKKLEKATGAQAKLGIEITLKNLARAKSQLETLLEKLKETNASENAIESVELAIANIESAIESLKTVLEETSNIPVKPGKEKEVREKVAEKLLEEIELLENRIKRLLGLLEKTKDEKLPIPEEAIQKLESQLEKALSLLESAKKDIEEGRIHQAMYKVHMVQKLLHTLERLFQKHGIHKPTPQPQPKPER